MPVSRRLPVRLTACLLLAAALMLAACRRNPPEPPRAATAQPEETGDAGAPVLAAALNARAAIAAGDAIAAFNDANIGLGAAVRLAGADSALYPPPAAPPGYQDHSGGQGGSGGGRGGGGGGGAGHRRRGGGSGAPADAPAPALTAEPASVAAAPAPPAIHGGHGGRGGRHGQAAAGDRGGKPGQGGQASVAAQTGRAPFTSFDAQVRLVSALAKLQGHDAAGADVDLQAVEDAVHPQAKPQNLPLIRAGQSLTLASAAVAAGRLGELRTQLVAAQAALAAYQGAPHAQEAKALATTLGDAVRGPGGPGTLAPAQIAL
jgi:hypothetical protein